MKIDRIHIDNFGKIMNFDLAFQEGLNQIKQENGWGKTTLSIFIKAMFYGMAPARDNIKMERKKYMPWQGGNFGGFIEFTTEKGSYRLTRYFGKTPEGDSIQLLNLTTNKFCELPKIEIGEEIFGVGKDTFEMTAFLPQLNFQSSGSNKISAGILGLEKFKYDLANLSIAIDNIKKRISQLKKDKPKTEEISNIKMEAISLNAQIPQLEEKIAQYEKSIDEKNSEINELELQQGQLEEQLNLKEQLIITKKKLEDELIEKSESLNQLLLQLNEIKIHKNAPQKTNKFQIDLTLIFAGGIVLLLAIILGCLKVFSILPSVLIAVAAATIIIVGIILLIKKRNQYLKENEESKVEEKREKEIKNKVGSLQSSINMIKSNLQSYSQIETTGMSSFDNLKDIIYDKKLEKKDFINNYNNLLRQKELCLEELEQKQEELVLKQATFTQIEDKIELLTLTKDFLMNANENVSTRFIEPINDSMREILSKLNMRDREFIIDTNFSIKEKTNSGIKEFEYSSQGYQDLLSFSMRVNLVKEIFKKEKPFIVLDDTFVNLDEENMEKIKDIVKDFADDMQIIYFCCNDRCSII